MNSYSPRRRRARAAAFAMIMPMAAFPARAALVAYDNFDAYVPGPLNALNGGTGWSGAWSALAGASIHHDQDPISYAHGATTLGQRQSLRLSGNAEKLLERAVASAGGGTRYVSFVFKIVGPNGAAGPIPSGTNLFSGWQARDAVPSPGNDTIGVIGLGGKASVRIGGQDAPSAGRIQLDYNQTYFCVIKYVRGSGSGTYNAARLWINPATGSESTANSVVLSLGASATVGSTDFAGLCVRTVGLSDTSYQLIDDLRIGTTWADVTSATPADGTLTIGTNLGWGAYDLSATSGDRDLGIYAGSPLDQSALIDHTTAGEDGFIQASGKNFVFEDAPGTPVRFVGVNICENAVLLNTTQADQLAEDIKRSGYNAVRLHNFDHLITDPHPTDPTTFQVNWTKFKQVDNLFRALKARGIYISIDLYSLRDFSSGEVNHIVGTSNIPAGSLGIEEFKALIPINTKARDSWRKYAQDILTYVNPDRTSGPQRWIDDPALISICMVNEDNLYKQWANPGLHAHVKSLYDDEFDDTQANYTGSTTEEKFSRFLFKMHRDSDILNRDFLRGLGVKALLTGSNYGGPAQPLMYQRKEYDYVDEHIYYNHPAYTGSTGWTPYSSHQLGSLVKGKAELPRNVMASRIFDKPFTVSEWNFSRPNKYRGEAALLVPALASLQDWNGLYCFQYGHDSDAVLNGKYTNAFSVTSDPINLISSRIAALLFKRGDFQVSGKRIAWALRSGEAYNNPGSDYVNNVSSYFWNVGLAVQIGMLEGEPGYVKGLPGINAAVTGTSPSPGTLPANCYTSTLGIDDTLRNAGHFAPGNLEANYPSGSPSTVNSISDTGEILIDSETGIARALADRAELFALPPGGQTSGDQVTSVKNSGTPATVCVIAVDSQGSSLASSNRILVAHLTDSLPQGAQFSDANRSTYTSWGGAPHLVARGETELKIRLTTGNWTARVIDHTGRPVARPPITMSAGTASGGLTTYTLQLSTVTANGTQLLYELYRQ